MSFKEKIICVLSILFCIEISLFIVFIMMLFLSSSLSDTITEFAIFISGGSFYFGLIETLKKVITLSAPLLCCSMAIIVPFKMGIFNIGIINQFMFASFGTLIFFIKFKLHYLLCIFAGTMFGAFAALIPIILKISFNINEVISGILLNFITLNLINYIYKIFLMDMIDVGDSFKTFKVENVLPGSNGDSFSYAFVLAIVIVFIVHFFLKNTKKGYAIRMCGKNSLAASCVGIDVNKNMIFAMSLAGAFAGIGSSLYYLSNIDQWCINTHSMPQFPAFSIVISFLSLMNPIMTILNVFIISFLRLGAISMNQVIFPREIGNLAIAIIIYIMLFNKEIRSIFFISGRKNINDNCNNTNNSKNDNNKDNENYDNKDVSKDIIKNIINDENKNKINNEINDSEIINKDKELDNSESSPKKRVITRKRSSVKSNRSRSKGKKNE